MGCPIYIVASFLFLSHSAYGFTEPKIDASQLHSSEDEDNGHPHTHIHIDIDDDDDADGFHDEQHTTVSWESLSSKEQHEAIARFFFDLDKDKDLKVSRDELKGAILDGMRKENTEWAKEELKDNDKNGDGEVTWEEFYESDGLGNVEESEKLRFTLADQDSNNRLTEEEFMAFLYPYDTPHMKEYLLKQVLKEVDADKDGMLSKEEFLEIELLEDEFNEEEDAFVEVDLDKNGKLNEDELYMLLSGSTNRLAESETEYLVNQMTVPKEEDRWSEDEIAANIEYFVDSNFEDQLLKYHTEL